MGIKSVSQELKSEVSQSRLFKALVTEMHDIAPKAAPHVIKSIETVEGNGISAGCVVQTNFTDEAPFKKLKYKIDSIDPATYTCKYTMIDGDVIGDKIEKICYEVTSEPSDDGGCIAKQKIEYHTKGDVELTDEEIKAGNEKAILLYKATEAYLVANPHVCA